MKFTKDKKYNFISYTKEFKVEYESDYYEGIFNKILRWQIDNYRKFSAYDSPKAEYKGKYVKCNYSLSLNYKTFIDEITYLDGTKKEGYYTFLETSNEPWNFHTKKELNDFLKNAMETMKKGIKDYYYNQDVYKIVK